MNNLHLLYSTRDVLVATTLVTVLVMSSFFAFEPSVGRSAVDTVDFTVTQQITGDISVIVLQPSVSMVGSVSGLTGGYATGTTQAVVTTNNALGYNMTLAFSSTTAMKLNGASSTINNYSPSVGGTPDYSWADNTSGGAGEFGYTVMASSSTEVDLSFKNNGSLCNTAGSQTTNNCWLNPSTTPEQIVLTSTPTPTSGSTSTIKFKVAVPNAPSPSLPSGFYVATGTLTATTNP